MKAFWQRLFGKRAVQQAPRQQRERRVVIGGTYKLVRNDGNPFERVAIFAFVLDRRDGFVSYRYTYPYHSEIEVKSDSMPEDTFLAIYERYS